MSCDCEIQTSSEFWRKEENNQSFGASAVLNDCGGEAPAQKL